MERRIVVDPTICHGKPVVRGTRVMVANILSLFAGGYDLRRVKEYYPELGVEDIKAAVRYAAEAVQQEDVLVS